MLKRHCYTPAYAACHLQRSFCLDHAVGMQSGIKCSSDCGAQRQLRPQHPAAYAPVGMQAAIHGLIDRQQSSGTGDPLGVDSVTVISQTTGVSSSC